MAIAKNTDKQLKIRMDEKLKNELAASARDNNRTLSSEITYLIRKNLQDEPNKPIANINPFGLRMQPELKESIVQLATGNNRSMNAEIISRLEKSLNSSGEEVFVALLEMVSKQGLFLIELREEMLGSKK